MKYFYLDIVSHCPKVESKDRRGVHGKWAAMKLSSFAEHFAGSATTGDTKMKSSLAIAAICLVLLNALLLVPAASAYRVTITTAALLIALVVLILSLAAGRKNGATAAPVPAAVPTPAPAAIQPPVPTANQAEAEVVAFFALLQEKGRFVDFLMEDITPYDDAHVGAAARVIHQGCRQVLQEHFKISAISESEEGSQVTVPAGYAGDQFRIIGKISGDPPFTGTLVHKGWKAELVRLPRIAKTERLPPIAPAEIELK
jgi:hypothetical protein